jgi:hypothetical protein
MQSLFFIVALSVFGVIAWWYIVNEEAERDGEAGLLALRASTSPSAGEERPSRYQARNRAPQPAGARRNAPGGRGAYRIKDQDSPGLAFRPRASAGAISDQVDAGWPRNTP